MFSKNITMQETFYLHLLSVLKCLWNIREVFRTLWWRFLRIKLTAESRYFCKNLHPRCLIEFCIRIWILCTKSMLVLISSFFWTKWSLPVFTCSKHFNDLLRPITIYYKNISQSRYLQEEQFVFNVQQLKPPS